MIDMALMEPRKEGFSWAYYSASIQRFLQDRDGCLAALAGHGAAAWSVEGVQMGDWEAQVDCLQQALLGMGGEFC